MLLNFDIREILDLRRWVTRLASLDPDGRAFSTVLFLKQVLHKRQLFFITFEIKDLFWVYIDFQNSNVCFNFGTNFVFLLFQMSSKVSGFAWVIIAYEKSKLKCEFCVVSVTVELCVNICTDEVWSVTIDLVICFLTISHHGDGGTN